MYDPRKDIKLPTAISNYLDLKLPRCGPWRAAVDGLVECPDILVLIVWCRFAVSEKTTLAVFAEYAEVYSRRIQIDRHDFDNNDHGLINEVFEQALTLALDISEGIPHDFD